MENKIAAPTDMQLNILSCIKKRIAERGFPPSIKEIGNAVGLSSSSSVHHQLNNLEKLGLIKRDKTRSRSIEVLQGATPAAEVTENKLCDYKLVTFKAAALLTDNKEENISIGTMTLPLDFIGYREAFLLEMQGDSMKGAGIFDGDLCIVKQQYTPVDGDMIAVRIDNEIMVRRFFNGPGYFVLEAENNRYKPLMVKEAVFLGKIIGLLRNSERTGEQQEC